MYINAFGTLNTKSSDVVGWYIHTLIQSMECPLTIDIVYRDVTSSSGLSEPSLQRSIISAVDKLKIRIAMGA